MLKKSLAWLLTVALCMSVFAGCSANKDVTTSTPVSSKATEEKLAEKPAQASDTLVVTTAGAVTPAAGIKHVIIEADGVILENAKLETITVSEKLGDGTATLKNVKAKVLNANGGGEHSIIILDSDLVTVIANRKEGKQHITINVGSTVKTFTIESEVIADIEGAVTKLVVDDKAKDPEVNILASSRVVEMLIKALTAMQIDAEVESVSITGDAQNSKMEVSKGGKVGTLATDVPMTTSGEGAIGTLVTNDKNNLKGSTLAADATTINQNPLNKNAAETQPVVKKNPGAVTPPPANAETPTPPPVTSKIELTIIGAEVNAKAYSTYNIAFVSNVIFGNLQNGDKLTINVDYVVKDAKYEDLKIGKDKKVTGTVALLPTANTAKYNLKDGTLVGATGEICKRIPQNKFSDLVTDKKATVPFATNIDLSTFFKKDARVGDASYTVVAKAPAAHSSKDADKLVVTTCGEFTVTFKTAETDEFMQDRGLNVLTLTVSKAPGTAIAETLAEVKPTAIGAADGKITGLDSKKLYEYKGVKTHTTYTDVTAKATEITGLAADKYTVRYKNASVATQEDGIGKEITIANPKKSTVDFAVIAQDKTVLNKLVSTLQSGDTTVALDANGKDYTFTGTLEKHDSWTDFGSETGYFVALQVNPQVGTTFTDAAKLELYKSNDATTVVGRAQLSKDREIALHVATVLPNPKKEFKVTIDLDGAGTEYETTEYTLKTGNLILAATHDVELTVKVDGKAANVAAINKIEIRKDTTTIALSEEGTSNVYKHPAVPTGVYNIFVNDADTKQTLDVTKAISAKGDLLYYTVTLNVPTGVAKDSSLTASCTGNANIVTETPLLKDTEITLTANVDPQALDTHYSSVFKNGANQIGTAVTGVPAKTTFVLTEALNAQVEITATLGIKKITSVTDIDITIPVENAVPSVAKSTQEYTAVSTVWNAIENSAEEKESFKPGMTYIATVTLKAKAGIAFGSSCSVLYPGSPSYPICTIASPNTAENTIVIKITYRKIPEPNPPEPNPPELPKPQTITAFAITYDERPSVGAVLTATGTYVPNQGGKEGIHTYTWYTSDDQSNNTATDTKLTETTNKYTPVVADTGKFIYCVVVPVGDGSLAGTPVKSEITDVVTKRDIDKAKTPVYNETPTSGAEFKVEARGSKGASATTDLKFTIASNNPTNPLNTLEFSFGPTEPDPYRWTTISNLDTGSVAIVKNATAIGGESIWVRVKATETIAASVNVKTIVRAVLTPKVVQAVIGTCTGITGKNEIAVTLSTGKFKTPTANTDWIVKTGETANTVSKVVLSNEGKTATITVVTPLGEAGVKGTTVKVCDDAFTYADFESPEVHDVTIEQTAKDIADADIAAAKAELEKNTFYNTISMANAEATADTTIKVQALVTGASTLRDTICTVIAENDGNAVRADGAKGTPKGTNGVYKFKVKITKADGTEQITKVMTITTPAIEYLVNDITKTALILAAPDSANAAAETAPTGIPNCTCDAVVWTDALNATLTTGTKFVQGTVYTATFTLTADDHYKFPTTFVPTCAGSTTVTQTVGKYAENNTCKVAIVFPGAK